MDTDYHIHTASTDGPTLEHVRKAARDERLHEIGLVDHCNVSPYNDIGYKADMFDVERPINTVEQSYFSSEPESRLQAIEETLNDNETLYRPDELPDIQLPDEYRPEGVENQWLALDPDERPLVMWLGVEMDYEPGLERFIQLYMGEKEFDYSIGSVHYLDDTYVPKQDRFPEMSPRKAEDMTEEYFEKMVSLVESEIFDILAHPGLIERNPLFEPHVRESHYREVAEALKSSSTVTEVNGKSVERQNPPYPVEIMHDQGVENFTAGTDTHRPEEISARSHMVDNLFDHLETEPLKMSQVVAETPEEADDVVRAV